MTFDRRDFLLPLSAAILIAPLWCVAVPAMPDYPAHLAAFFMIAGGAAHAPLS